MSKPWNHVENKMEDLRLTINNSDRERVVRVLREIIHSEAMRLSVEIQYAKRYEKAKLEGEKTAYRRIWDVLGGDVKEETEEAKQS